MTGSSSRPQSDTVVAIGGGAPSRLTTPACSSSFNRSASKFVAIPGSPLRRSVYRQQSRSSSSRTIMGVHRSLMTSSALARAQDWLGALVSAVPLRSTGDRVLTRDM